jgi:hypothetical protein
MSNFDDVRDDQNYDDTHHELFAGMGFEEGSTEKQNATADGDPKENNANKGGGKKTIAQRIVDRVADEVSSVTRNQNDREEVKKSVRRIMTTLFAISALDQYDIGLRVNGDLNYLNDYMVPSALSKFCAPGKVVAKDVPSAIDFSDKGKYIDGLNTRDYLTASQLRVEWRRCCSRLRIQMIEEPLQKKPVMLLADAVDYAVFGGKVPNRDNATLVFLRTKFDDQATDSIEEWARALAVNMTTRN